MKIKAIKILSLVFLLIITPNELKASIDDVYITPETPIPTDIITINVLGTESTGAVLILNSEFQKDDTDLSLDVFLDVGHFQVITPWDHTEIIGTLPYDTYDLTVNAYINDSLAYTHITSFEVVPEPASILLFTFGTIGIFANKRRRC